MSADTNEYLNILSVLPDIVYRLDAAGRFTYLNQSVQALGYEPEQLIGRHFGAIVHPEDVRRFGRQHVLPKYKGRATGTAGSPKLFDERRTGKRKTVGLEIRLLPKHAKKTIPGEVTAIGECSATGYYDGKTPGAPGKLRGSIGIIRDITVKKETEAKLHYQADMLRHVSDAIISTDSDFNIRTWNRAAEKLYGFEFHEVEGKPLHKVTKLRYPGDSSNAVAERIRKEKQWRGEVIQETKDGQTIYVESSVITILDGSGIPNGTIAVNRDITERKKIEQLLLREKEHRRDLARHIIELQEKERLNLASEIHDELLQGLTAILYFMQMIDLKRLGKAAREQRMKLIRMIKSSIERGRILISNIEPLRKPELGLIQILKKLTHERPFIAAARVDLICPKSMPRLEFTVQTNIIRIIHEALINIGKHARASKVKIAISATRTNLVIEISDNGIGFDINKASRRKGRHFGMSIMQERAYLIGGKLNISSKPGRGTTIRGEFPVSTPRLALLTQ